VSGFEAEGARVAVGPPGGGRSRSSVPFGVSLFAGMMISLLPRMQRSGVVDGSHHGDLGV
jgi:hypothetical protein